MIYLLDGTATDTPFPDIEQAEIDPNGLLAIGGDLSPQRLVNAYTCGIFPWYSVYEPILWWSPDPRLVLFPQQLHISRSLSKTLKRGTMIATTNQAFSRVIHACADTRHKGSWLITDMIQAEEVGTIKNFGSQGAKAPRHPPRCKEEKTKDLKHPN